MPEKKKPADPVKLPAVEINPETDPAEIPPGPLSAEEELDLIPDEELDETAPYEIPEPGEGP